MSHVFEIAPDVYRISVLYPEIDLQFNHFLIRDDEPLLFHTGLKRMYPEIREAVARLIDPASLRWVAFSHFESDECGSLNDWLAGAPKAEPACNFVSALVNINDFAIRPARIVAEGETLSTGRRRFRFIATPQVPHGWDAGVLYEETTGTLFCSDLCHQHGDVEPLTTADVVGRTREAIQSYEAGPLAGYAAYNERTGRILERLAQLQPKTLAIMHGSSYAGDCGRALRDLNSVFREVLGEPGIAARGAGRG